jgi:hypothetical protein
LSFWRALAAPVMRHVEPSPSKPPQRERTAWVPSTYSVHFDGMTYLQNNGLPTMQSSSTRFLLSFWYNGIFPGNYRDQNILLTQPDQRTIVLGYYITPSIGGTAALTIVSTDMTRKSNSFKESIKLPYDDGWHHVLVYLDTQAASCRAYIDDSAATVNNSYTVGSGFKVNCAGRWCVSYRPYTTPAPYTGHRRPRRGLRRQCGWGPACRGRGTWLESHGAVPQIWLSGGPTRFPRNYPGWSATMVQQFDSDPTSQFAVTGDLTSPAAGPFDRPPHHATPVQP